MRTIRGFFPLRHWRLQPSLRLTFFHQLGDCTTSIDRVVCAVPFFRTFFTQLVPEVYSGELINVEAVWLYYNPVILLGSRDGDESAVYLLSYTFSRACEGIAKATATPRYPLQYVACISSAIVFRIIIR